MPRKKFPRRGEDAIPTLTEVGSHDDVCTDILVDHIFLHIPLRKHRARYTAIRGIDNQIIIQLLRQYMMVNHNLPEFVNQILQLPGVATYLTWLHTRAEHSRFQAHLSLWACIYAPDCAWEITTTNRYTLSTYEAATAARTTIPPGQDIRYLCGVLVDLSVDDEDTLTASGLDFSVMRSHRKERSVLMVGPARLVNHDCTPNAILHPNQDGIQVRAIRQISVGQEITVSYGGDYFGHGNSECLCRSCEAVGLNGWSPRELAISVAAVPTYQDTNRHVGQYFEVRRLLVQNHFLFHHGTRTPGDYVLTKTLLPLKYDKWSQCQVPHCGEYFVQREGHQTRRECHRCERHRAIFQLTWPATCSNGQPTAGPPLPHNNVDEEQADPVNAGTDLDQMTAVPNPFISPARERHRTRQGLRLEADIARLRGSIVGPEFAAEDDGLRRSRRRRHGK